MIRFCGACILCAAIGIPLPTAAQPTPPQPEPQPSITPPVPDAPIPVSPAPNAAANAAAVLKQMAQAYSACKSYRDTGTSLTKFLGDNLFENKIEFKTAFRRPVDFRFEYTAHEDFMENRMIIHRDKAGTRTWWSIGGGEENTTIESAIASATGVSSGTAFNVPTMLFPDEVGGCSFPSREDWTVLPDAQENDRSCYRLTRKEQNGDYETIWIDKAISLVMRIDERRTIDGKRGTFVVEQTTLYRPEINIDIPGAELQFNAPAKAPKEPARNTDSRFLRFLKALVHR